MFVVVGQPGVSGGGAVQTALDIRAGKHHVQRRTARRMAALQANPHGKGQEGRKRDASLEASLLRAAFPFAVPVQGQAGGGPTGRYDRGRGRGRPTNQHPRLPGGHRVQ